MDLRAHADVVGTGDCRCHGSARRWQRWTRISLRTSSRRTARCAAWLCRSRGHGENPASPALRARRSYGEVLGAVVFQNPARTTPSRNRKSKRAVRRSGRLLHFIGRCARLLGARPRARTRCRHGWHDPSPRGVGLPRHDREEPRVFHLSLCSGLVTMRWFHPIGCVRERLRGRGVPHRSQRTVHSRGARNLEK